MSLRRLRRPTLDETDLAFALARGREAGLVKIVEPREDILFRGFIYGFLTGWIVAAAVVFAVCIFARFA